MGVGRERSPLTTHKIQWPRPHKLVGIWDISLVVKLKIVGLAGVCPSCSQKRESTVFELILRNAWGLSSPSKQVGGSSTPGAKFGVKKFSPLRVKLPIVYTHDLLSHCKIELA